MSTHPRRYAILSRFLGLVLILAGLLKGHDLIALDRLAFASGLDWFLLISPVLIELVLGAWLLVGLYPKLSWWLLVTCFIVFMGVTFDKAMAGATSCGCLGAIPTPPWLMFGLDAVILLLLVCSQPIGVLPSTHLPLRFGMMVLVLGLCVTGLWMDSRATAARFNEEGDLIGDEVEVRLQPSQWQDKRFPLARHLDIGRPLLTGRWAVMFHYPGCGECGTLLPQFVAASEKMPTDKASTRFALIEIPNPNYPAQASFRQVANCLRGRLAEQKRWRMPVPLFLVLEDGIVQTVSNRLDKTLAAVRGQTSESEPAETTMLFPDYPRLRREMFLREIACGPLALIAILKDLGIDVSPEKEESLIDEAGDNGIDMLRLKQLAEERGLHALGVAVTTEQLRDMKQKAIVHLNNIGFAAVTGFSNNGVTVVQPLTPPGVMPNDHFSQAFGSTGYALLISRQPLSSDQLGLREPKEKLPIDGPRIELSRNLVSVGRIHHKEWRATLELKNIGNEVLRINKIDAAMEVLTDKTEIEPGEMTVLRIRDQWRQLRGYTDEIRLHTNQKTTPIVRIPVRGYLEQPVGFSPPTKLVEKQFANRAFAIDIPCDVPKRMKRENLRVRKPEDCNLTAEIRQKDGKDLLHIQCPGIDKPGWYTWKLSVYELPLEGAIFSPFHLVVEVIPEIDVYPNSVWISTEQCATKWNRTFTCRNNVDPTASVEIVWADPKWSGLFEERIEYLEQGVYSIYLSPKSKLLPDEQVRGCAFQVVSTKAKSEKIAVYIGDDGFVPTDAPKEQR